MTALRARGLAVAYGVRTAVAGVDLAVTGGEVVGLIGPNACGKTTLVRALAGLQPPAAGSVELKGRPLAAWPRRARARTIGYLAQGADCHWPMTAAEVVALGRLPWGDDGDGTEALARVGADHLAGRRMDRLSGGERRLVLLARVLAGAPRIVLADEPVAALDPGHALQVMGLLRAEAGRGSAVVAVLHDLALASRFCDRLALMAAGGLRAVGVPEAVLTPAILAEVYGVRAVHGRCDGVAYTLPWARVAPSDAGASRSPPDRPAFVTNRTIPLDGGWQGGGDAPL